MKLSHLFVTVVLAAPFSLVADDAPAFPSDLKLTNNAVLHKAKPERWESDYVVVRHVGGIDRIRYVNIAEPQRSTVLALKDAPKAHETTAASGQTKNVAGQVFVTTQGAGAYKFAGATVRVYAQGDIDSARSMLQGNLPASYRMLNGQERERALADCWTKTLSNFTPVASAQTDADGNYSLSIPTSGSFSLFCVTHRLVGRTREGTISETNTWIVPVTEARIDLNTSNSTSE